VYDDAVSRLREFFRSLGYIEVPSQCRTSILAACEDPKTMSLFTSGGTVWPLVQTGQMELERELLSDPNMVGCYCVTTSYRDEPNPIPGRHERVFPMFEFEGRGDMEDLIEVEARLLGHLGLIDDHDPQYTVDQFVHALRTRDFIAAKGSLVDNAPIRVAYEDLCENYGVNLIDTPEEEILGEDYHAVFLTDFPQRSHPFWNMKRREGGSLYAKVDVLLYGQETIGSAERSTNIAEMRDQFEAVSDGQYAQMLFNAFGERRVREELEAYFDLPLEQTPRFGGGIGLTRLIRALELHAAQ